MLKIFKLYKFVALYSSSTRHVYHIFLWQYNFGAILYIYIFFLDYFRTQDAAPASLLIVDHLSLC